MYTLFDQPIACAVQVPPPVRQQINPAVAFAAYHNAHPEVYRMFEQFVFELLRRGKTHYSADAIMHRVRWETSVSGRDEDDFKINNNHVSYYARLFIENHPELKDFFETRRQRND